MPNTGDLEHDLRTYLSDIGAALSEPHARQVLGALVTEASSDPELAEALRTRVSDPRRLELATRLNADHDRLAVPVGAAIDQLVGPVYYRALITGLPVDGIFVDAVVSSVIAPTPT